MDAEGFLLVLLLAVGVSVSGLPAPQSLKLGGGEVGASFGGYSASAGLGGLLGGGGGAAGGLHAEAGTGGGPSAAAGLGGLLSGGGVGGGKLYSGASTGGGTSAAAGLGGFLGGGGGKLYSGASTGGGTYAGGYGGGNSVYGAKGGSFFDRIFDIPISTLNSVNRFLNEGGASGVAKTRASASSRTKVHGVGGHYRAVSKVKTKQVLLPPPAAYPPPAAAAQAGAFASAGASNTAGVVAVGGAKGPGYYDRVFDIPVSVLSAVNRLLNGH